jgi:hypothetical protein
MKTKVTGYWATIVPWASLTSLRMEINSNRDAAPFLE